MPVSNMTRERELTPQFDSQIKLETVDRNDHLQSLKMPFSKTHVFLVFFFLREMPPRFQRGKQNELLKTKRTWFWCNFQLALNGMIRHSSLQAKVLICESHNLSLSLIRIVSTFGPWVTESMFVTQPQVFTLESHTNYMSLIRSPDTVTPPTWLSPPRGTKIEHVMTDTDILGDSLP